MSRVKAYSILPECFGNTMLIEMYGYNVLHFDNIGQIGKSFKNAKNQHLKIAFTDDDKRKTGKLLEFTDNVLIGDNFAIRQIPNSRHYGIFLKPAIEKFTWNSALQSNIEPANYNFGNYEYYHSVVKSRKIRSNKDIKRFWNSILQKKDNDMVRVKDWIGRFEFI